MGISNNTNELQTTSNELQTVLNNILTDKKTNLKSENLKKGVTCLGVTGTYEGSGGGSSDYNARLVPTNGKITFYITEISTQLNTSNVTNMNSMFQNCTNLTEIPLLNTSSVTNMQNMFSGCTSLSDDSLNNILAMCTNATSYTGTKTLKYIGLTSVQATKCTTLSNYSAFTAAGWTTGY